MLFLHFIYPAGELAPHLKEIITVHEYIIFASPAELFIATRAFCQEPAILLDNYGLALWTSCFQTIFPKSLFLLYEFRTIFHQAKSFFELIVQLLL